MPPGFRLLMPPDAAVPDDLEAWHALQSALHEGPRGQRYLRVVGRMRAGVAVAEAQPGRRPRRTRDLGGARLLRRARAASSRRSRCMSTPPATSGRPLLALSVGVGDPAADRVRERRPACCVARAAARARETAVRGARRRPRPPGAPASRRGAAAGRARRRRRACCSAAGGCRRCSRATPEALESAAAGDASTRRWSSSPAARSMRRGRLLLAAAPLGEALPRRTVGEALQHDGRRPGGGRRPAARARSPSRRSRLSVVLRGGCAAAGPHGRSASSRSIPGFQCGRRAVVPRRAARLALSAPRTRSTRSRASCRRRSRRCPA